MLGFVKSSFCLNNSTTILKNENYTIKLYSSVATIDQKSWNIVLNKKHLYLSLPYLKALEKSLPNGVLPLYAVIFDQEKPVFITNLQLYTFNEEQLASLQRPSNQQNVWLKKLKAKIYNIMVKYLQCKKLQLLVFGNILQTGAYSFVSLQTNNTIFFIDKIVDFIKKANHIDAIILKDFEEDKLLEKEIKQKNFLPFYAEPNMKVILPASLNTMEDYYNALNVKYKKRFKSASKKIIGIKKIVLNEQDLMHYENEIYDLFEEVYHNSDYKINKIKPSYFFDFKKELPAEFQVIGYFKENVLIGFASYFKDGNVLEANYIGMQYAFNESYKLYQNILYDYVQWSIENHCKTLCLSRTGLVIKSTIGAIPEGLLNFVRLENRILHTLLKPVFNNIKETAFEQRHPFKESLR